MKILPLSFVAIACMAVSPLASPQGQTQQPPAGKPPPPKDRAAEFSAKFKLAVDVNAKDEIAKLLRAYTDEAITYIVDHCEILTQGGGEQIEKDLAALREGWKLAFKSSFVDHMYNFYSLLDPRNVKELEKITRAFDATWRLWDGNKIKKDPALYEQLVVDFESAGKAFAEIGNQFQAARAFALAAKCSDTEDRGASADLNRAADDFGAATRAIDAFEMKDTWALSVKQRFESLTKEGRGTAGGTVPGSAPAVPTTQPVRGAAPIFAPLHFEAVPDLETYSRPSYFLDDVHILWPQVYMKEKGTSGAFQALDSKKVKMLRTGASAVSLDLDGDGKGDMPVPSSGNKALLQFSFGEGAEKRDWAVVTEVGTDKESYQGLQVNYGASDQQFQIYVMNAASMVGTLGGVPVRVFDDNMDGIYGSPPKQWGYPGLVDGSTQSDIDSMLVGTEKHARPWSEFGEVGGIWYQFEPQKAGTEMKAQPSTLETGKLKLECKGELPEYVIVQGEGSFEKTYIDLLQNGGAEVSVPVGKYKLFFGLIRKGKKQQVMKSLILPGRRTPAWIAEAGKTTVVPFGAPYSFDFSQTLKDGMLTVKGSSVTLIGASFERYERLWNCVAKPELAWRKAGTKRGSKPEKFPILEDLNARDEQGKSHDPGETFHPLDLTVETKLKDTEGVEVQLIEKKNKLFGAIESAWHK